jgi:hypothetical protein
MSRVTGWLATPMMRLPPRASRYRAAANTPGDRSSDGGVPKGWSVWRTLEYSFKVDVVTSVSCKRTVRSLAALPRPLASAVLAATATDQTSAEGGGAGAGAGAEATLSAPQAAADQQAYLLSLFTTNRGDSRVLVDSVHALSRTWECSHLRTIPTAGIAGAGGAPAGGGELKHDDLLSGLNRACVPPSTEAVYHLLLRPRVGGSDHAPRLDAGAAAAGAAAGDEGEQVFSRATDDEAAAGIAISRLSPINSTSAWAGSRSGA